MAARIGISIRRIVGAGAFSLMANGLVFARLFGPMMTVIRPTEVVELVLEDAPDADGPSAPVDKPVDKLDDKTDDPKALELPESKPKPKPKPKPEPKPKPQTEPPKPQPLVQRPPAPPPPLAPPPPPMPKEHLKSVEQDQFPDESQNASAQYLAEKNHRVKEDTRSTSSNLVKRVDGSSAPSEQSENRDDSVGGKEEKIAELQDQAGDPSLNPESASSGKEQALQTSEQQKPGALGMRNLMPIAEDRPQKERRDGVELDDPERGSLPRARKGEDRLRATAPRHGVDLRVRVDSDGLDRIIGYDVAAAQRRQGMRAERSMPKGRYDRYLTKLTAMRSAIENFLPEVKPGNQQELGTRASPFAAYIAAMHRMIHKHWTFGFLTSLEANWGKTKLFEDATLWTQLEIVLKTDGVVDKVTIVRTSGNLPFDTAAIDSVLSSSPFPTPPSVIRSANGKVYLDWKFHRDERACGTYGVDPHILTTPGDNSEHDTTPVPKTAQARPE